MEFKTDLGRHLYVYSEVRKLTTPPEIVQELSEAYCVREQLKVRQILFEPIGIGTVEVEVPASKIRLDTVTKFYDAFKAQGYPPPFMEVIEVED